MQKAITMIKLQINIDIKHLNNNNKKKRNNFWNINSVLNPRSASVIRVIVKPKRVQF